MKTIDQLCHPAVGFREQRSVSYEIPVERRLATGYSRQARRLIP